MSIIVSTVIAKQICDALGLDGQRVKSLDLHFSVDSIATATVTFLPDRNGVERLPDLVKHYTLTERKE